LVPAEIRRSVELWIGCLTGALEEEEYREKLAKLRAWLAEENWSSSIA